MKNLLLLLLLLLSCACSQNQAPANEFDIMPAEVEVKDNQIYIKLADIKSTYLKAEWQDDKQYQMVGLEPTNISPFGENRQILIYGPKVFERLMIKLGEGIVPQEPDQGVLLLFRNQEYYLYRDEQGHIQASPIHYKAEGLRISATYRDADIGRKLTALTREYAHALGSHQLFFITGNITPGGTDFIYIDSDQNRTIFMSHPYHLRYEQQPQLLTTTLQGLNSVVIKGHLITFIKNPFTTIGRLCSITYYSTLEIFKGRKTPPAGEIEPLNPQPMNLDEWEEQLDHIVSSERCKGSLNYLIDGETFFPRLLKSLNNAEESIHFQTYIFDNDDYAKNVADLLKQKSETIQVKVLTDELGTLMAHKAAPTSPMPADYVAPLSMPRYLKNGSNIKVRTAKNPWFTGDHTKTIIIDEQVSFVGGMNIGREYRYEWHDLMIEVDGAIVSRLMKDFHKAWAHAGLGGDIAYAMTGLIKRQQPCVDQPGQIDIRPLYTRTGNHQIYRAQLEAIKRAQQYIYIENAYFSDTTIRNELIRARQRGVDVRIILPSNGNHWVMNGNNLVAANILIENQIRVYKYPGMSHVKAAVYDGWACLGSANFDKLSLKVNMETNLAFSDPATVNRLKRDLFEHDMQLSEEITEPFQIGWGDYFASMLANQL